MKNRLSYVILVAGALGACGTPNPTTDTGLLVIPDSGTADTNVTPPDANRQDTGGPASCNSTGLPGAHCRANMCQGTGTQCLPDQSGMTVLEAFTIPQGDLMDPAHPGYQAIHTPADPASGAPLNAFAGTLCGQQCDTSAMTDTCGACTSCSATITQMPLIAAFGGAPAFLGRTGTFGSNVGLCRLDCTWNATGRSAECPDDAMACDAFGSVCIEACTADSECNTTYGATYDSQLVIVVNDQNPEHCSAATGRCEATGTPGAAVGITCESNNDCLPGSGICLSGGHCAEFGCDGGTALCGAGNVGVCVRVNDSSHPNTLCIKGCTTAADCGAGGVCSPLTGTAGTFTGICLGVCNTDDECQASETCTDTTTTDGTTTTSNPGRCVPRCGQTGAPIRVGDVGTGSTTAGDCATDEFCQADHVGAAYGQCSPLGGFCGAANTNNLPALNPATEVPDCATTQVCDETLATPHGSTGAVAREDFLDGHCVNACTADTDCTGGATCVTDAASPLHGLCRHTCSAAAPTCPTDQTCNTTLGRCVEVAPPAM